MHAMSDHKTGESRLAGCLQHRFAHWRCVLRRNHEVKLNTAVLPDGGTSVCSGGPKRAVARVPSWVWKGRLLK